jgi:hypothetical protein
MSRSTLRLAGLALAAAALAALFPLPGRALADADGIRPWDANPRYWQYKGEPTLLLGGTDDDNRQTLDHPDLYDFADLSQNNHNSGPQHWQNAVWAREYVAAHPRPINAVKTYGADGNRFGHSDQDGLERFFRHLLAGFASARFHRPDAGLGSSAKAQAAIAMVRRLESLVRLWELSPDPGALDNGQGGDVYTAAAADGTRVLYFPAGGRAALPLAPGGYDVAWVGARDTIERTRADVDAGVLSLSAPDGGHWLAVLRKR